jgi:hypothetical protein
VTTCKEIVKRLVNNKSIKWLLRGLYIFKSPYKVIVTVHIIKNQHLLITLQTLCHQDYTSNRGEVEMLISIRSLIISVGEAQLWCVDQGQPDPSISTPARKLGSAKECLQDWRRRNRGSLSTFWKLAMKKLKVSLCTGAPARVVAGYGVISSGWIEA